MRKRFYNLKRVKVRQSWNKYNLYNLSRMTVPSAHDKTFFQQKWAAKSLTRAYHGEQIREGQWTRMFRRTLPAVVEMDYRYLAKNDGSEQAAGRGSGQDERDDGRKKKLQTTPYMHMTYYPIERRLDTAIFRALFASSTRQARQFVVHGWVKVNGKKMIYPGYLLNPGDMFSVDPERVMWATGAAKDHKYYPQTKPVDELKPDNPQPGDEVTADVEAKEDLGAGMDIIENVEDEASAEEDGSADESKQQLKDLSRQAQKLLKDTKELPAKRKQELREFRRKLRSAMTNKEDSAELQTQLEQIMKKIESVELAATAQDLVKNNQMTPQARYDQLNLQKLVRSNSPSSTSLEDDLRARLLQLSQETDPSLTPAQTTALREALTRAIENPVDPSKPYATPWRPREWMSAFAFIPRYLEVNQNICSAVYLRHPVARPGLAEVPTPFHFETSQLAFNWYLRRR